MKKTFLFIPGAWMGEWIWESLKKNLEKLNHNVHSITLSGLNSRDENKDFGLQDHVNDVKNYIINHELTEVFLVGHSYSGFVIGQVADQMPEKIRELIFIEAFLPVDNQNLFEGAGLDPKEENEGINYNNGNWPPPKLEELKLQSNVTEKQVKYLNKNLIDHPARSVQEKSNINSSNIYIPAKFIGAKLNLTDEQKSLYGDVEFCKLNGGHWPMLSETKKLTNILNNL